MQKRIDSPAQGFSGEFRNPFAFLLTAFRLPTAGGLPLSPQFGDMTRRLEPVVQAATRAQLESLSLVAQQVRTAYDLPSRLAACRTPQEVASTQVQFWRAVATQQAEGVQRIAAAWGAVSASADAPAKAPAPAPKRDIITFPDAAPTPATAMAAAVTDPTVPRFAAE